MVYQKDKEHPGRGWINDEQGNTKGYYLELENGEREIRDNMGYTLGKIKYHWEDAVVKDSDGNEHTKKRFVTDSRTNLFGKEEKTLETILNNPVNHDAAEILRGEFSDINIKSLEPPKGKEEPDPLYTWLREGIKNKTIDIKAIQKTAELKRDFLATTPETNKELIRNINQVMAKMNWIFRDMKVKERFDEQGYQAPGTEETKQDEQAKEEEKLEKSVPSSEPGRKEPAEKDELSPENKEQNVPDKTEKTEPDKKPEEPKVENKSAEKKEEAAPMEEKGVDETLNKEAERIINEEQQKILRDEAKASRLKVSELQQEINKTMREIDVLKKTYPGEYTETLTKITDDVKKMQETLMIEARVCAERERDLKEVSEKLGDIGDKETVTDIEFVRAENKNLFEMAKGGLADLSEKLKNAVEDIKEKGAEAIDNMRTEAQKQYAIEKVNERRFALIDGTPVRNALQSYRTFFAVKETQIAEKVKQLAEHLQQKYLGKEIGKEYGRTGKVNTKVELTGFQQSKVNMIVGLANKIEARAEHHAEHWHNLSSNVEEISSSIKLDENELGLGKYAEYKATMEAYNKKHDEQAKTMNPIVEKALKAREEKERAKAKEAKQTTKEKSKSETRESPKKAAPSKDDGPVK